MAKWKSVIFSDIRNKLGDQVVFSIWKGRGYMRSLVTPANPKTNKQTAHRAVMTNLVARWGEVIGTADKKAVWNEYALPDQISGYNKFVKIGRKSKISVPTTASGTGSADVTVTYTLGLPANEAKCYRHDGFIWEDVTPAGGLSTGADQTFTDTVSISGTYVYYIATSEPLVSGDSAPEDYQAVACWEPDETNGVADKAECVVTIS